MKHDDVDEPDPSENEQPKRRRWWLWVLGLLLLMVLCDDDDDDERRSQFCYDFSNGEERCFANPLPKGKHCYIEADDIVRCYDQPPTGQ